MLIKVTLSFLFFFVTAFYKPSVFSIEASTETLAIVNSPPDWEYHFEQGWNAFVSKGSLSNRFENAKKWRYSQMQTDQAGIAVVDPVDSQNYVMKFTWKKGAGKEYDLNTQKKAHLYGSFGFSSFQEELWKFRVYFPKQGMEKDKYSEIIVQWHGYPDLFEIDRNPPLALDNRNDELTITWLSDSRRWTPPWSKGEGRYQISLGDTPKNQWVDFVFRIKWGLDGSGLLKVWQDGVLKVEQDGISIGFNDRVAPYFGFGIYKFDNHSEHYQRIVLFDDIKKWAVKSN